MSLSAIGLGTSWERNRPQTCRVRGSTVTMDSECQRNQTKDAALTRPERHGEAVSKPKIQLITQRSQVQILSPLLQMRLSESLRCYDQRDLIILGSHLAENVRRRGTRPRRGTQTDHT